MLLIDIATMNKSNILLTLSLSIFFLVGAAPQTGAEPLKAHIEHSTKVEPVAPQLRAGSQFNQDNLPRKYSRSKWFAIPRWMAGEWRRKEVHAQKNGRLLHTQKDVRQHRYGFQTDSEGKVWHWVRTPHPTITEQVDTISYFLIRNEELVASERDKVSVKITWTTWVINKRTRIIEKVIQGIQVDTYRPQGEGVLMAESHVANYNQDGKLLIRQDWCWKDDLMVYYEPVDQFEGVNVKLLFNDYLKSHNLARLLPR